MEDLTCAFVPPEPWEPPRRPSAWARFPRRQLVSPIIPVWLKIILILALISIAFIIFRY